MKKFFVLTLCLLIFTFTSFSQTVDPWITKAYMELYKRAPTAAEANIKNYNNGSWNSYCELVGYIAGYNRSKAGNHLKGDPWIFQAYCELYSRVPTATELDINNYNRGSWNSYAELKTYIQTYNSPPTMTTGTLKSGKYAGKAAVVMMHNGVVKAVNLLSSDGAKLLGSDGVTLIGNDSGGLVGNDGASLIGMDGGTFISTNGSTINLISNIPSLKLISNYQLQSIPNAKIGTWGKYKMVVK